MDPLPAHAGRVTNCQQCLQQTHRAIVLIPAPRLGVALMRILDGKTSRMQMVESELNQQAVKTVWFNAWKYSGK